MLVVVAVGCKVFLLGIMAVKVIVVYNVPVMVMVVLSLICF